MLLVFSQVNLENPDAQLLMDWPATVWRDEVDTQGAGGR